MDANHLSKRLTAVAQNVPQGARLADIGSDHAYLPAALIINQRISYAIAGEVVQGPFENEQKEIIRLGLQKSLIPRLADGLAAIKPEDKIDTVTIAGMGGSLIAKILDEGQAKLAGVARLVLQPNVGENRVRAWLMNHQYQIQKEQILNEDHHTYEVIVAEPTVCPVRYGAKELLFGPLLLEQSSEIFNQKWQAELKRCEQTINQMQKAKTIPEDHLQLVKQKMALIKEVIPDDYWN